MWLMKTQTFWLKNIICLRGKHEKECIGLQTESTPVIMKCMGPPLQIYHMILTPKVVVVRIPLQWLSISLSKLNPSLSISLLEPCPFLLISVRIPSILVHFTGRITSIHTNFKQNPFIPCSFHCKNILQFC